MAVTLVTTTDSILNGYLGSIYSAEYGREARAPIASAIDRCYTLAIIRAGSAKNGITKQVINEHINRVRNAVFGEEVRDAIKTGLQLCYSACDVSISSSESSYLNNMINAQTGEDLKNEILRSIARCCQDVKAQ